MMVVRFNVADRPEKFPDAFHRSRVDPERSPHLEPFARELFTSSKSNRKRTTTPLRRFLHTARPHAADAEFPREPRPPVDIEGVASWRNPYHRDARTQSCGELWVMTEKERRILISAWAAGLTFE